MRRLLLVFLLLLAGCLRDDDPFDVDTSPLQVHGVIRAGETLVTVLVSTPGDDRESYDAVSGADVFLIHDDVPVRLSERTSGPACAAAGPDLIGSGVGCYSAVLPQPVQPGGEYELEVMVQGRAPVTGRTRVPDAVTFMARNFDPYAYTVACPPLNVSTICSREPDPDSDSPPLTVIEIAWLEPAGAAYVDAQFRPVGVIKDNAEFEGSICRIDPDTMLNPEPAPRGSVRWPIRIIECDEPIALTGWDTIDLNATVAVYDSAYGQYIDATLGRDAARRESVSAGLDGAIGVFGSVNVRVRELVLVRVER